MGLKRKALIGIMALCLLGSVGGAVALTTTAANGAVKNNVDSAVVFSWNQNSIPSIESLKGGVRQYSYVGATVNSSKSVAGTVTVSFTLAAQDANAKTGVLTGLTVTIYQASVEITSENVATYAVAGNKQFELDATHLTNNATFSVVAGDAAHATSSYFAIAFDYDGSPLGASETLSGTITLNSAWANA